MTLKFYEFTAEDWRSLTTFLSLIEPSLFTVAAKASTAAVQCESCEERGCSIYIAAAELMRAGIDPYGPEPWYKVWSGFRRKTVIVRLYANS
jgi:hypothetical protein